MATLDAATWLATWEHSHSLPQALRPCALLAPLLADGQAAAERLPLGQRDASLLDLHLALFGPELQATACCHRCGERLELSLDCRALRLVVPLPASELQLHWQDVQVRYRLPDSRDLAALAQIGCEAQARSLLLQRCIEQASRADQALQPAALPADVLEQLAAAMASADPQAVTELALSCPACGSQWQELFDIGVFLLERLGHWAERQLDQVHVLAQAYGWSEAQIFALSPARRARYLSRVLA